MLVLDRPYDMLDFRLAIWQVGFYLGQMTSPEYEKYKFEQWGKNYFQKPHLFFEVYLGLFLRNPYFFENTS